MEAEYMASSSAAQQAAWLRTLLNDIGQPRTNPLRIYNDNNDAIALAKNPVFHDRAKHVDILYHHPETRSQTIANNCIDLTYIKSANNLADILTKALPPDLHACLVDKMGMLCMPVSQMGKWCGMRGRLVIRRRRLAV